MSTSQRGATELTWVFRPAHSQPDPVRARSGAKVHAFGAVGADGRTEVVLQDGTRLRASPAEVVAES
jgi:hypothetical protein